MKRLASLLIAGLVALAALAPARAQIQPGGPVQSMGKSSTALGITFTTPGDLSVGYSSQAYSYLKSGRLVVVSINILTAAFTFTTASGNLTITGLPFPVVNDPTAIFYGSLAFGGITKAGYTNFTILGVKNTSTMLVVGSKSASDISVVTAADMPSGGTVRIQGTLTYWTD
jgi:hypothetical protein